MAPSQLQSIRRVLIANRGEIAVRCIRACKDVGVASVSVYTASDAASLHVSLADESVLLAGDGSAGYLDIDDIVGKCKQLSIDAVVPGYGFLSENVDFAKAITDAGMVFVGPSAASITEMGLKHRAREVAIAAKVPIVPGTDLLATEADALEHAEKLRYPVMLKATGGGGGMGLQICHAADQVKSAFETVRSRGEKLFKNAGLFLEKFYPESHHIEVQVFGNGTDVIHFGERECSIQRRHQKVIEECPSPFVVSHPGLREKLASCATNYAAALHYKSAGTVEFLVDDESGDLFFLEMNTRLQVEHGITELCYGVDLVVLMLKQADMEHAGKGGIPSEELKALQKSGPVGAAIEARVYAEDPYRGFVPSPGIFPEVHWPEEDGIRIDTWIRSGQEISLHYDPLLAKVMAYGPTRNDAIGIMSRACNGSIVLKGPTTNLDFVGAVVASEIFDQGKTLTNFLDTSFAYTPCGIDILHPGPFSTIQDFPGRPVIGHGVPKSGPMDSISSRIANFLVSNPAGTEVIEITLHGPELLFTVDAVVSVCGAKASVTVDGAEKPMWSTVLVKAGQRLKIGAIQPGAGCRAYLAVRGGFPGIPYIFGSRSTTPSLKFGGYQGRALLQGDFLLLDTATSSWAAETTEYTMPSSLIPSMVVDEVYVMQGPHDSGDIMTANDRDMLYTTDWKVGHNASRTGVRMLGPVPEWARKDGGEAGSHPSNYLDYGYPSPGGVNWGGDSACIFSVDSPNFGGLICSTTVISSDLWKLGQLKPASTFKMTPVSFDDAAKHIKDIDVFLDTVEKAIKAKVTSSNAPPVMDPSKATIPKAKITGEAAILKTVPAGTGSTPRPQVIYRQGGDRFLMLEVGGQTTDVAIIVHIHQLVQKLEKHPQVKLTTPHVGSVIIEYDPLQISQAELLADVDKMESTIESGLDHTMPCRHFRLPLVMDHPDLQDSITKYMDTVRDKAAYLPDNVEFLRKCNRLETRRAVFQRLLDTKYLIGAVGFLCGTPMLIPMTPENIQTMKYNPTRVSTVGGTIGIGGAMLSVYTVEQPGGYMMAARTLEMWDPYGVKPGFAPNKPWLLETFDLVTFEEVSVAEYDVLARNYFAGCYEWKIEQSTFDVGEAYRAFQEGKRDPRIIAYQEEQKKGLAEQDAAEKAIYAQWLKEAAEKDGADDGGDEYVDEDEDDPNTIRVTSPMPASVWKVEVKVGDALHEGLLLSILEAMKLEINIPAPKDSEGFKIVSIPKKPGSIVNAGDVLFVAKRST